MGGWYRKTGAYRVHDSGHHEEVIERVECETCRGLGTDDGTLTPGRKVLLFGGCRVLVLMFVTGRHAWMI